MAGKFYHFDERHLNSISWLFQRKKDGEFVVIQDGQSFCDICQYSSKYNDVHIIAVSRDKLDWSKELSL